MSGNDQYNLASFTESSTDKAAASGWNGATSEPSITGASVKVTTSTFTLMHPAIRFPALCITLGSRFPIVMRPQALALWSSLRFALHQRTKTISWHTTFARPTLGVWLDTPGASSLQIGAADPERPIWRRLSCHSFRRPTWKGVTASDTMRLLVEFVPSLAILSVAQYADLHIPDLDLRLYS